MTKMEERGVCMQMCVSMCVSMDVYTFIHRNCQNLANFDGDNLKKKLTVSKLGVKETFMAIIFKLSLSLVLVLW